MQPLSSRVPKYRLHKPKGLGVVRLDGHDVYLGKYNTPESLAAYRRVIAEWLSSSRPVMGAQRQHTSGSVAPVVLSMVINELVQRYLAFAKTYYVKHGRPTREIVNIKDGLKALVETHGPVPVTDFGPIALKAVRQTMIDRGWCRGLVNQRVNVVRRMFKWGVEEELVPASILHGLQAVAPLKRGRCQVRDTKPVLPIPDAIVDATIKAAPRQIAAMIELQRLTGMRPGEIVLMRTSDIDMTGQVWIYTPSEHKMEHHDRGRLIHLGPQAQQVIGPFLRNDLSAFIFDPREVQADRQSARRAARRSPMTPSQQARGRKVRPKRTPGDRYTTSSYAHAISFACDQAFPHPLLDTMPFARLSSEQRMEVKKWRKEHRWSPNRLRHNAATYLRKQFGIEAARVVLGHKSAEVTEIYAERDLSHAADIMKRVG